MKYTELNNSVKPEYINAFRLYPTETELVIDFALTDHAATRIKAENDGREKPENIIMETKARIVMPHATAVQLHQLLSGMLNPPKKEEEVKDNG